MTLCSAGFSEFGPRLKNEDFIGIWHTRDTVTAAVADGLGGMGGGEVASKVAIECLEKMTIHENMSVNDLTDVAKMAHARILELQSSKDELKSMATTFTAAMISQKKLIGVHCGDTRLIIARRNGIKSLSTDQTEGRQFLEEGKINKRDLRTYPRNNILYSALGVINKPLKLQKIEFDIESGDKVVIASDGVHQVISMSIMRDILSTFNDPKKFIEKLKKEIEQRGAKDNYSVVTVFIT
jgi:protein phosphatase